MLKTTNGALPTEKPYKIIDKSDLAKAKNLCEWYSYKLSPQNLEIRQELFQQGITAFVEAYQRYKKSLGYSAITFTAPYVKGEILRYWNRIKLPVKIPHDKKNSHAFYSLGQNNLKKIDNHTKLIKNAMNSRDLDDLKPDEYYKNEYLSQNEIVANTENKQNLEKLKLILGIVKKKINSKDLKILQMRILGDSKLKDVARKLNYSIEGIRKKEARILNLIKLEFKNYEYKNKERLS